VGLEWGPLSLLRTTEELLGRNSSGSGLENRDCQQCFWLLVCSSQSLCTPVNVGGVRETVTNSQLALLDISQLLWAFQPICEWLSARSPTTSRIRTWVFITNCYAWQDMLSKWLWLSQKTEFLILEQWTTYTPLWKTSTQCKSYNLVWCVCLWNFLDVGSG
jgi:hypothetical protein